MRPLYGWSGLKNRAFDALLARAAALTLSPALPIRPPVPDRTKSFTHAAPDQGRQASFEDFDMSRRCELTAKGPQTGHTVSHSNIKTKRRFLPNLCNVTFISDTLGRSVRLKVSANAIRSVDHRGGLDAFLIKAKKDDLSRKALDLKRQIEKKRATA